MTEKNALLTPHESPKALGKAAKVGALEWAAVWIWEKLTGSVRYPA